MEKCLSSVKIIMKKPIIKSTSTKEDIFAQRYAKKELQKAIKYKIKEMIIREKY